MSDLPKTRVKDKTIKVSKITKMNCAELLTVTSRERERERQREREFLTRKFAHF